MPNYGYLIIIHSLAKFIEGFCGAAAAVFSDAPLLVLATESITYCAVVLIGLTLTMKEDFLSFINWSDKKQS